MIEFIQLSRGDEDTADNSTSGDVSPHFIWVVRDFSLSLKIDQRTCTADEYLEHALKDKPGTRNSQRNEVRKKIREFFPTRKCFTLKRYNHSIRVDSIIRTFLFPQIQPARSQRDMWGWVEDSGFRG